MAHVDAPLGVHLFIIGFHPTFSRHGIAQILSALGELIWLNEKVQQNDMNSTVLTLLLLAACAAAGYGLAYYRTRRALEAELQALRQQVAEAQAARADALARLDSERAFGQRQMKTLTQQMQQQTEALRTEFRAVSADVMRTQSETLRTEHLHSLEQMLKPLGADIEAFRTQYVEGSAMLKQHLGDLRQQTASLTSEADQLAKALRGNTKLQGNWGEAVLTNLLEAAGLTEGRDRIPDVVVHLPGDRHVVIDSKVSLTAYTDYVAATTAPEQDALLREHVRSVRQHIKELAAKNYDKLVKGHIGYVLLFIPGEGPYVSAVSAAPTLTTEAYAQHVILINPTNLLMALQLAYNLWQSELQSKSVKEIYDSAEKVYRKFCTFAQNFVKMGNAIRQLQNTYDEAGKQLTSGRGNLVGQLEAWREKGLTTNAKLPPELTPDS